MYKPNKQKKKKKKKKKNCLDENCFKKISKNVLDEF